MPRLALLLVAAALLGACGTPASAEGTVGDRSFRVDDQTPELRQSSTGEVTIILGTVVRAEADRPGTDPGEPGDPGEDELLLITLTVPSTVTPVVGEPLAIGRKDSGLIELEVAWGTLVVETRPDGTEVATTTGTKFVPAVDGSIVFWELDKLWAADFSALLADGGDLKGSFSIDAEDVQR